MSNIPEYVISPSDSDDWFIIELKDKKIKLDVEKRVLTTRFDCVPHQISSKKLGTSVSCSQYCCYMGCYITPLEIKFVEEILPKLRSYLSKKARDVLKKYKNEFYLPEDYDPEENLYKTRCCPEEPTRFYYDEDVENEEIDEDSQEIIEYLEEDLEADEENLEDIEMLIDEIPESSCIFLMDDGLCAVHKYCDDHGLHWPIDKFNICTTFPIDIRVSRNETAKDTPYPMEKRVDDDCSTLKMMDEYEDFMYAKMNCINLSPKMKAQKKIPFIIDSMKYAIESRLGEEMWLALHHYALKLRNTS